MPKDVQAWTRGGVSWGTPRTGSASQESRRANCAREHALTRAEARLRSTVSTVGSIVPTSALLGSPSVDEQKKHDRASRGPGPRDWAPLEAGHTPFKRVKSSAKVESGRPSRSPHRGAIGDITGCHLDSRAAMQDERSMPCRPRDEFAPRERSLFAGTNAKHVQSCQPHMGPGVQGRADARLWSCGQRQQFSLHREYVLQVSCCINVLMLLRF